jgi:uncharacterized protein (TIGR03083 family)
MIDRERCIRMESDRIGETLGATDLRAMVPTCPDWNALDLLKHVTQVHGFWAAVIGDRLTGSAIEEFERNRPELPDDPVQLQALRLQATVDLLTTLNGRDPSEPAWSWFPPEQTVGFTWRMQTHEATMHRVDAELAAGLPISPIDSEVAADGVSHVLDVMWAWTPVDAVRTVTGTVELQATDTGDRWLANTIRWSGDAWGYVFADQPGCVRVEVGEPDATISGTAESLDLLVWSRADRGIVRRGHPHILSEFQAVLDDGIK